MPDIRQISRVVIVIEVKHLHVAIWHFDESKHSRSYLASIDLDLVLFEILSSNFSLSELSANLVSVEMSFRRAARSSCIFNVICGKRISHSFSEKKRLLHSRRAQEGQDGGVKPCK